MKAKKIYFATTNKGKVMEAQAILGIEVEGVGLEKVIEIQSLDAVTVATHKAGQYFEYYKKPIVAEDTFLFIDAMKGLPGPYYKDFEKTIGNKGLLKFLEGEDNRGAIAQSTLVYMDGEGSPHHFLGVIKGTIAASPRGQNGFGWDEIFIPEGSQKTLSEMTMEDKNKISMRAKAFYKFRQWLDKK